MKRMIQIDLQRVLRDKVNLLLLGFIYIMVFRLLWIGDITSFYGYPFLHQIFLFWSVLLGYRLSAQESEVGMKDWVEVSPQRWRTAISHIVVVVLFTLGVTALAAVMSVAISFIRNLPGAVIREGVSSLFLYYGLGMVITGCLGVLIGRLIPHKAGYLVALMGAFAMGEMGFRFIKSIATFLPDQIQRVVIWPLNLGVENPQYAFNPLYGFDISIGQWIRRLALLSGLLLLMVVYQIYRVKTKKSVAYGLALLLLFTTTGLSLYYHNSESFLAYQTSEEKGPRVTERLAYLEKEREPLRDPSFQWKALSLRIHTGEGLAVEGVGTAEVLKSGSELEMNLYHGFTMDTVTWNGQPITFVQEGDSIRLQIPEQMEVGDTREITFTYRGYSPYRFLVDSNAVYLPGYFNWIPQPATSQSLIALEGDLVTLPNYAAYPVDYSIEYEGVQPDWTNVSSQTTGSDGVHLIAGHHSVSQQNGVTVVTTADRDPIIVERYARVLYEEMRKVADPLHIEVSDLHTVIAMPFEEEVLGGIFATGRMCGGVFYTTGGYTEVPAIDEEDMEAKRVLATQALQAILMDEPEFMLQSAEMHRLFVNGYLTLLYEQDPKYLFDEDVQLALQEVQDKELLLQKWYQNLKTQPDVTKEEVLQLIQSVQGGEN